MCGGGKVTGTKVANIKYLFNIKNWQNIQGGTFQNLC